LKVLPLPDAQTIQQNLATRRTNDIKALEEAKARYKELSEAAKGYYTPESGAANDVVTRLTPAVRDYSFYDSLEVQNAFKKACPSASPEIVSFVTGGYGEKNEFFTGGFSQEITKTLNMIKSDNGWVGAR
jgi:hypothetical protein